MERILKELIIRINLLDISLRKDEDNCRGTIRR